jgi:hypothetical protein
MNRLKTTLLATFVSLGALASPAGWAGEGRGLDDGSIKFAKEADGASTCTIRYMAGDYDFVGEEPDNCVNDEMSYFRLENVPSASQFELEKRRCHESGGWVVTLTVFKNPTTTNWISIPSLRQYEPGDIIVAGLRLKEKKEIGDDDLKGELSCVRIRRSPLP